ncbi:MAG: CDC48 family AAA ATPase [Chloroherpetonaceae bacterium]|nr:CDC48 family AAA ATPase [Chloroherpetonaceae bacterium]MCS7210325.1 CDC48 family AAA ATPase [Chloroherpetonaceae bacterium]MDW8019064.1 CDC48 family AAA ATPase [Chloroherpetonaceae bacterium]MDW8465533.1 CDC48 family AAA ATPase [Chloroherpetonaceae bacterium]
MQSPQNMEAIESDFSFRVKEALAKDVGRAIARLDPEDMRRLGIAGGDIIEIRGKRTTLAKAMPCYAEDRGKRIIQIDGLLRENAQAGLDEKVKVEKAAVQPATRVVLQPLSGALRTDKDMRYIASLIDGTPVLKGDRIRIAFFGIKPSEFRVLATQPEGAVLITANTQIRLEQDASVREPSLGVSYEDIGGLGNQIQRIREMVELPLRYPELFERLGIRAPKGVLLYGPPGSGKTLIARAVANETDAYFTSISGPEIMGKLYGESEARLRAIFEEAARKAPAIIFIDEIDAIAPKREDVGSEKQVEKRVVAQLLTLMDGLSSRGQVIVIGATNIPNAIDPALRRPGRFDREISIPIPDQRGRLEILSIHTRGMPLSQDVSLEKLAEITHGFVGADLEALAREAAMSAIRQILPTIDLSQAEIPYETLMSLEVTMENFREALRDVEPSAIREVFVEVPNVRWEEVGGLDDLKQELIEAIEFPLRYKELYSKLRLRPPKGILLYGPPGTGKTLLAKAVASQAGINFISVKGAELLSRYVGESERAVRNIFKIARQAAPAMIFFDEIDALAPRRSEMQSDVADRVVSQLLTEMDGIEELSGVIVLAATNRIDRVDAALLRSGRFELQLQTPMPNQEARLAIFKIHLKDKPIESPLLPVELSLKTEGCSGADIEFLCRKAATFALREAVLSGKHTDVLISARHFEKALMQLQAQKAC